MKYIVSILTSIFTPILLLCLQICLLKYEQNLPLNLILIAYTYALFKPQSKIYLGSMIIVLDMYLFIQTGIFYFITPIIAIFSFCCLKIKDNFYNMLVMPLTSIFIYQCIQSLLFYITLNHITTIANFIFSIIINGTIFTMIWLLTKQPLHN